MRCSSCAGRRRLKLFWLVARSPQPEVRSYIIMMLLLCFSRSRTMTHESASGLITDSLAKWHWVFCRYQAM